MAAMILSFATAQFKKCFVSMPNTRMSKWAWRCRPNRPWMGIGHGPVMRQRPGFA